MFGFNDTSKGHFVTSSREREIRDSRRDESEEQGRKRNRNESEETEEMKTFPPLPLPARRIGGLAQLLANISWTPRLRKIHDTFTPPNQPRSRSMLIAFVKRLIFVQRGSYLKS